MAESPPRFITPEGFARIRAEYEELFGIERPKLVEIVSWAASLGDRSENADYLYGKKRLREIDRRAVAPLADHESGQGRRSRPSRRARDQVRFGATVELADEDDNRRTLTIVGDDETDASAGKIGWSAPIVAGAGRCAGSATNGSFACPPARKATR